MNEVSLSRGCHILVRREGCNGAGGRGDVSETTDRGGLQSHRKGFGFGATSYVEPQEGFNKRNDPSALHFKALRWLLSGRQTLGGQDENRQNNKGVILVTQVRDGGGLNQNDGSTGGGKRLYFECNQENLLMRRGFERNRGINFLAKATHSRDLPLGRLRYKLEQREVESSFSGHVNLRCLLDIQVEMSRAPWGSESWG